MNYIQLIKDFWTSHEENCYRTTEIALYFYLVEVCNKCSWKQSFKRNNRKIEADLNLSYNTLKESRNRLKQSGMINFETRNGDANVTYTLSNFDKVTNEVTNEVVPTSSNFDEVSHEVTTEVGTRLLTRLLPRKDKLKLNKTEAAHARVHEQPAAATNFSFQVQNIFKFWADCKNLPSAAQLTERRGAAIAELLKIYSFDEITECMALADATPTLTGKKPTKSGKLFRATIDWVIDPNNFVTLYEQRMFPQVETDEQRRNLADKKRREVERSEKVKQDAINNMKARLFAEMKAAQGDAFDFDEYEKKVIEETQKLTIDGKL